MELHPIEAGVLRPNRVWLSLAEVAGGPLTRMRRAMAQHRVTVQISDDLPLVPADYVQLDQVFTDLISNSLKYAPPGSAIIRSVVHSAFWVSRMASSGTSRTLST